MRKIISLFILIFTLSLGSSVLAVTDVSWNDFKACVSYHSGLDLDELLSEEQNLNIASDFRNSYSKYGRFWVCKDWYWTVTPNKNTSSVTTLYFIFFDGGNADNNLKYTMNNSLLRFTFPKYGGFYSLDIHTNTITKLYGESIFLEYNIVSFPDFSPTTWKTIETFKYFLSNISVCGYNVFFPTSTFSSFYQESDVIATPFPWSEQPYYPWDEDDNKDNEDNNLNSGDSFVDTYIPPASGKIAYFVKAPQSYLYNERYSLCTIFLPNDWSFEDIYLVINKYDSNDNILERSIIQNYNNSSGDNVIFTKLESGFWSCNLADWYDFDTDSDVWYTVSLYSYEDGLLDSSRAFYFNLNMTPDNPKEDNDDLLNYDNTDFNDLINSSKSWVSNIFGFLNIFPTWLVNCILGGITVVIICRILGR